VDWTYVFGRCFAGAAASLSAWPRQRVVFSAAPPATHALPRLQPGVGFELGAIF
jgi:hypothetical protein